MVERYSAVLFINCHSQVTSRLLCWLLKENDFIVVRIVNCDRDRIVSLDDFKEIFHRFHISFMILKYFSSIWFVWCELKLQFGDERKEMSTIVDYDLRLTCFEIASNERVPMASWISRVPSNHKIMGLSPIPRDFCSLLRDLQMRHKGCNTSGRSEWSKNWHYRVVYETKFNNLYSHILQENIH
jgi:hypothetical protein